MGSRLKNSFVQNARYNAFVIVILGFSENEGGIENDILSITSNKPVRQIGKTEVLGLSRILDNRLFIYQEALENSVYDAPINIGKIYDQQKRRNQTT